MTGGAKDQESKFYSSHLQSIDTPDFGHVSNFPPDYSTKGAQSEDNPIPLPPRDRNKLLLTSKPRHTRKHPLIIPASSIQRTLDKVNLVTTPEERSNTNPLDAHFMANNVKMVTGGKTEPYYINQRLMGSDTSIETPERDFDTESLHFEAQIDSDLAALDEIPAEDLDTQLSLPPIINLEGYNPIMKPLRQGFSSVSTQNLDRRPVSAVVDEVDGPGPKCATSSSQEILLCHNVDHVSCEDLLEFADAKPSSRARGNDSDEVRIMSKVLGVEVSLFFVSYKYRSPV